MVRLHRRFSLEEVTLEGSPVGGATIDAWEDGDGTGRWTARLLVPNADRATDGELRGRMRDGRRIRGEVHVADTAPGPRRTRVLLVELHGDGPLLDEQGSTLGG
jgi:hypothetical protein